MSRLLKAFILLISCLVTYHIVVAWLWHTVGYQHWTHWYGLVTYIVRGVAFPLVFARAVFHGVRENDVGKWWKRKAYWIGLLPLLASAVVDIYVFLFASGLFYAPGYSDEGVGELIVLFQWAMTAFILRVAFSVFDWV